MTSPGQDKKDYIFETDAAEFAVPRCLRIPGAVPSRYYLPGAAVIFSLAWTAGLIYLIIANY